MRCGWPFGSFTITDAWNYLGVYTGSVTAHVGTDSQGKDVWSQIVHGGRELILVSVSGFGQYGPYRDRPAFDSLGQAMGGLMALTGQPEGHPVGTASSVVDRYTALHATIGTLAALRHRERTGEGQLVGSIRFEN